VTDARWCTWHRDNADDTVLIRVIEVGSGPGAFLYACADCVTAYRLVPLQDHHEDGGGSPPYELSRAESD
jgi:hypothetical protein